MNLYTQKLLTLMRFFLLISLNALMCVNSHALDFIAPTVEHKDTINQLKTGEDHIISAKVTDNVAVGDVILFFRVKGEPTYRKLIMTNQLDGSEHYEAIIQGDLITSPGLEYYIQASDSEGNSLQVFGDDNSNPFQLVVVNANIEIVNNINIDMPNNDQPVLPEKTAKKKKTWLWVALGAVVAGAAIASAGGSSSGPPTGSLDIEADIP